MSCRRCGFSRSISATPIAAGIGAVWIIGRVVYFIGYSKAAAKRGPGFIIQGIAAIVLWAGALGGGGVAAGEVKRGITRSCPGRRCSV